MTIVLLHGAWHGGWCFAALTPLLIQRGYHVHSPTLPGHRPGDQPGLIKLADYTAFITEFLTQLATPVIIVAHSMAGIIATEVAAQSPSLIQHIIYLAAYIPLHGDSLLALAKAGKPTEFGNCLRWDSEKKTITLDNKDAAASLLYRGVAPEMIVTAKQQLCVQPLLPFVQGVTLPISTAKISCSAIVCTNDDVIDATDQQHMCQRANVAYQFITSGHSPFLSQPEQLAIALDQTIAQVHR